MSIQSLAAALYKGKRGQMAAKYGDKWFPLGDVDFSLPVTPGEKTERYTNEFAIRTLALSEVDQLDVKPKITFYQASRVALMIATLSTDYPIDQPAAPDLTWTFEAVGEGEELPLWKRRMSNIVVTDGTAAVIYVEGINYRVHKGEHGMAWVSIILHPEDADGDVIVTGDAGAAKGTRYYIGSQTEIRLQLVFIEDVKPIAGRYPDTIVLHDVGFIPTGDWVRIGSDSDLATIETEGTAYRDTTQPDGQQLGYLETNVQAAA